jgi:hypothetical protein
VTYIVTWGRSQRRTVATTDDLDAVLDEITATGVPTSVGIYPPDELDKAASPWDDPPKSAIEVGIGHPDRSFIIWLGPDGGIATDPTAPPWPTTTADIAFDYGGDLVFCGPDRAAVTPETARTVAREYVRTGTRPRAVIWTSGPEPRR